MIPKMMLFALCALSAPTGLAMGAEPPPPVTDPLQASRTQLTKCQANIAAIARRMQILVSERERVEANRRRLQGSDADLARIDGSLKQIQSEIDMRSKAVDGLRARCEALRQRIYDLKNAPPG